MVRNYYSENYGKYPNVKIVKTPENEDMELWLRRLRAQGILYKRQELIKILDRMFSAVFYCIKKEHNIEGYRKWQIILILRDAIVAFLPALEVFPDSAIGLIGHERFLVCPRCKSNIHISAEKCSACELEIASTKLEVTTHTEVNFTRFENPEKFEGIIIVDIMIASGGTIEEVINEIDALEEVLRTIEKVGKPKKTIVASVIMTEEGVKRISNKVDYIYGCTMDRLIDGKWIFPGMHGVKDVGEPIFHTFLDQPHVGIRK